MKIISICLNNIGLYKNEKIMFPTDKQKSTTIFWGNNGAGKTTFINSVKISLLGKNAFRMSYADYCEFIKNKMISTRCDKSNARASIDIEIEIKENNQNKQYVIHREWIINNDNFEENVIVYEAGNVLEYERKERLLNIIQRLLPTSLLDVIIFDGENAINILNNGQMNELIRGIIYSVFGMDVYVSLSKDLTTFLKGSKSNADISSSDQYDFVKAENEYRTTLSSYKRIDKLLSEAIDSRTAKIREITYLAKRFNEKTGIDVSNIEEINKNIAESENQKELFNSELRFINEEILPLKLLHSRIKGIRIKIEDEKPFVAAKYINELKNVFSINEEALNILKQLERYVPDGEQKVSYDLAEADIVSIQNLDSVLSKYTKRSLLDMIDNKNDYLKEIRRQMGVSSKVEDKESQDMLARMEKMYSELEGIVANISELSKDRENEKEQLEITKKNYDLIKADITKKKKTSSSYVSAMLYRDSIDKFIAENTDKICRKLNQKIQSNLDQMRFRNGSISEVRISPKSFDLELYEKNGKIIQSSLFSAGEKQVLLGLVIKEALSISKIDTFFLFDTPVGRLDVDNRSIFTKEVIFTVTDQVAVFATDSDYSKDDYKKIKDCITKEVQLVRNDDDEIIVLNGGIYQEV